MELPFVGLATFDAQEMRYVQWPAKQSIERLTAGILKHRSRAAVVVR
jgi:hypothetical protein